MAEEKFIQTSENGDHKSANIQLAVAALMIEVVKADHRIDRLEVAEVINTLRDNFELDANAVGRLLELGGDVGNHILRLESLTTRIRELWGHHERLQLLRDLWTIAGADKQIDVREVTLIEKVSLLLDVDESLAAKARSQAEQAIQG